MAISGILNVLRVVSHYGLLVIHWHVLVLDESSLLLCLLGTAAEWLRWICALGLADRREFSAALAGPLLYECVDSVVLSVGGRAQVALPGLLSLGSL